MNKHRLNTFQTLARMGISNADAAALVRASATLSTWAEHECNGVIQQDETRIEDASYPGGHYWEATGKFYWFNPDTGRKLGRTSNREAGAVKRAQTIAARYGLTAYHQTDPRGCALYLVRPGDVPDGADIGSYYSRGVAVVAS